ncbi:uncharacterized protein ACIB01_012334 isoform 1-T1 [Guaruba guarouba]
MSRLLRQLWDYTGSQSYTWKQKPAIRPLNNCVQILRQDILRLLKVWTLSLGLLKRKYNIQPLFPGRPSLIHGHLNYGRRKTLPRMQVLMQLTKPAEHYQN